MYWPALDGLRAVAVLLVFGYHAERSWMPRGGSIGVTMFFTLSGFLITTLLLRERSRTGRISLRRFYRRRALRLLPAIVVLVAVTSAYSLVTGDQPRTLDAAIPVLLYVFNWFRALPETLGSSGGYGLLEHTWSLSVEEQFYLVWPLAVLVAAALVPRRQQAWTTLVLAVGGSAASLLWRLQLWDVTDQRSSAARLYNGTDAVADQLLVGAALAAALALWDRRLSDAGRLDDADHVDPASAPDPRRRFFDLVGAVLAPLALAYLVWVAAVQPGGTGLDNDRRYLELGSLTFALATAVVVLACTRAPTMWLPRLLARRAPVEIGKVSYGIYLWHFPVILVVDEQLRGQPQVLRGLTVVAATTLVVLLSWRFVERPFLSRKERTPAPDVAAGAVSARRARPSSRLARARR